MKNKTCENKKSRWPELILWMAVIAVAVVLYIINSFAVKDGDKVIVKVEGEQVASYSLDEDGTYTIKGKDGGTNELVIKDGKACIDEASCPDKLCVKQGEISKKNQSVVCLPNQVVIEIKAGSKDAIQSDESKDGSDDGSSNSEDEVDAIAK